jgi:hypothetical protein
MSVQRSIATVIALALASALGIACGGNGGAGGVRETGNEEQRQAAALALGDQAVVEAMKAPQVPGRIIYDPPTDLSLANAMRTRPDLVRGDTARRDASGATTRRDTTGGDATVDTSGGAARSRRP